MVNLALLLVAGAQAPDIVLKHVGRPHMDGFPATCWLLDRA